MTETSGPIHSESLGKWDQGQSCWRTCQASMWEAHHMGAPWSESWPKQGMTRSGELYPLPTQGRLINEPGGGLWHIPTPADVYTGDMESSQQSVSLPDFVGRFPTPVADGDRQTNYQQGGTDLGVAARLWPSPDRMKPWAAGKVATPPLALAARMLPTPRTKGLLGGSGSREMVQAMVLDGTMSEEEAVALLGVKMWATPRVDDSKNNGSLSQQERHGPALNVQVKQMLPTPSAGGDSGGPHGSWAKAKLVETFGEEQAIAMSGGSLSPDWVSWLMGLPVGWTSLEPLPREEYLDWFHAQMDGTWWQEERGLPRVATGIKDRVNRLKCLGNGIVPASLSLFLRGLR